MLDLRLHTQEIWGEGELCGFKKSDFEKRWEIKSKFKNILNK